MNDGLSDQARFEQYRLAVISSWPDSETKQVALASARSALARELALMQSALGGEPSPVPRVVR
jgi:hypothetical protein